MPKIYGIEFSIKDIEEILFTFLHHIHLLPKVEKTKIGIIIAISSETSEEKNRIENDLVSNLRNFLEIYKIPSIFDIIILDEKHSKKIYNFESSLKYLKKCKGHLIIYGNIRTRINDAKENYIFNLEATVLHKIVPTHIKEKFEKEFGEVFTKRWVIPKSNELLGFEITHVSIGLVIQYIVGIAAYISGDINLAYKLYNSLEKKLSDVNLKTSLTPLVEIKKRLPLRFVEIALNMNEILYLRYVNTRDIKYIAEAKEYLDIIKQYNPTDSTSTSLRSMYYFLIENNIDKAISELTSVTHSLDSTWRYNLAFLYAYKGNLSKAKRQYDRAFREDIDARLLAELEIFITSMIEKFPKKAELYFIRGYLIFKAKGDLSLAKEDFIQFLNLCPKGKLLEEIRLTNIYIKQIH